MPSPKINNSEPTPISLKTVHTGLFVNWEKRNMLLQIVQDMLQSKFHTTAVTGPRQSNNTCEIVIRALVPSGANFFGSKELLESYLNMVKECKPNIFIEKQPEVIDLEADNDDTSYVALNEIVDESIAYVDLDESVPEQPNKLKMQTNDVSNKSKMTEIIASEDDDIIVVDSIKSQEYSSKRKSVYEVDTGGVIKESDQQARKRKKYFGEEKVQGIEVVEILDDDIIVLEDSFSTSSSQNCRSGSTQNFSDIKVTVTGDSRTIQHEHADTTLNKSKFLENKCCTESISDTKSTDKSIISESLLKNPPQKIQKLINHNTSLFENFQISLPKTSTNSETSDPDDANSSPFPPKKSSKLSYKRPAHLVLPLTQSSSSDTLKADSLTNIYNPNAGTTEKRTGLRPIVIDGNNVAISHGKGQFSLRGIQICINYFEKRGHRQIKAFVPHYRKNKENHDVLHKMERQGTVVITPSRKVDGKVLASYDDRYIVQYAAEFGGVIVSTDNFRDLLRENSNWKDTIENRLLMFTWVDDLLMFPQDPLGRNGPSLDDYLKFPDT